MTSKEITSAIRDAKKFLRWLELTVWATSKIKIPKTEKDGKDVNV